MSRVKRGLSHLKRRRTLLKRAKGFEAGRKKLIKLAKTAVMKAGVHAYRDRKVKKRDMRGLWNVRVNAAIRAHGMSYSKFIFALKQKNILLNRKMLAELGASHPEIFEALVASVK
ncbi:MAG: 50S ribosomal protein L20 [Candidatus Magasanikbacteria bacterium]|nr:50S ribosomal protein L20 [Candidatus Magasanikbacteria bacterium]